MSFFNFQKMKKLTKNQYPFISFLLDAEEINVKFPEPENPEEFSPYETFTKTKLKSEIGELFSRDNFSKLYDMGYFPVGKDGIWTNGSCTLKVDFIDGKVIFKPLHPRVNWFYRILSCLKRLGKDENT